MKEDGSKYNEEKKRGVEEIIWRRRREAVR